MMERDHCNQSVISHYKNRAEQLATVTLVGKFPGRAGRGSVDCVVPGSHTVVE